MRLLPIQGCIPNLIEIGEIEPFIDRMKEAFNPADFYCPDQRSLYVYRIISPDTTITGLICELTELDRIYKHETVIPSKAVFIGELIGRARAVIKPIMGFYPSNASFTELLLSMADPRFLVLDLSINQERHQVFRLDEEAAAAISRAADGIDEIYIADGHHRLDAVAGLMGNKQGPDGVFSFIYDEDQVVIKAYNRDAVFNSEQALLDFLDKMEAISVQSSSCERNYMPRKKGEIVAVTKSSATCFTLESGVGISDMDSINRSVFETYARPRPFTFRFLNPDETEQRLHANLEPTELVLIFYPVSTNEIIETAGHGAVLPPKSTWFHPKVRSGVIVSRF